LDSFILGFLLGTLSYWTVDWVLDWICPFQLKHFSDANRRLLEETFHVQNKVAADSEIREQSRKIRQARTAALHMLWTYPQVLPIAHLTSKRDAESLAVAGLILLIDWNPLKEGWRSLVLFLSIIVLGLLTYWHYRKRTIETPLDVFADVRRRFDS
jgi:hypothetical protein